MRTLRLQSLAGAAAASLAILACGPGGGGTGSTPAAEDTSKGEIIIASDLPTSGNDASSGLPTQQGAQFAVTQKKAIKGFKLTFLPFDDSIPTTGAHDPQKGAQNVQAMIGNTKVLGMVGPFNSNVARAEIPLANDAELSMISPSNTNECLTQSFPYCNPQPSALRKGKPNNYFRLAAVDTIQGPAMADFAVDTLGKKKIAIFSDNETFGKGVADNFAKELTKKGGTVASRQDFDMKTVNDFKPFLTDAKAKGAEAVYAGATSATKGCIVRAQAKGILDVPFLGPDGIVDGQCIKDAGSNAEGMYGTVAAPDATQSTDPAVKAVVDAYKKQFPKKEDIAAYTFVAYDCASVLIDAIGRAIDTAGGKMPTRAQVRDAVAKTKGLKTLTGTYTFDNNGDVTTPTMAFFTSKGGDWVFSKQFAVGG
jgi:branched-chain amino acid transport system substrate-binding protein